MIWIKVCGITSEADALAAIDAGVSAIGLIFTASPREVSFEQARDIAAAARDRVEIVGVFKSGITAVQAHRAIRLDRIQIHGTDAIDVDVPVLRARHSSSGRDGNVSEGEMTLIDGSEGRGVEFDWLRARPMGRVVVAGGLTAENVGHVIAAVRPFGVDVSSGVETAPGRKDRVLMARFVQEARKADAAR